MPPHGEAEFAGRLPYIEEASIVRHDEVASDVRYEQSEVFPDLETCGAGSSRIAENIDDAAHPARSRERRPIGVSERGDPTRMRAVEPLEILLELVTPAAVEIHERLDAIRTHGRE